MRKWTRERRIGHAGTLDPLATGVLVLCLGKATRVSPYLMASTKVYRATVRLGLSTDTHDAEGQVVAQCEAQVSLEQLQAALPRFVGTIAQVPPAYSAVKREGKPLYRYARQGVEMQAPPRQVEIHTLSVVDWSPPEVILDVVCGPGTYIRALARDLGVELGCGASLVALRRLASGQFDAEQALPVTAIEQAHQGQGAAELVRAHLQPLDAAFAHLPAVRLDEAGARLLTMGQGVTAEIDAGSMPSKRPRDSGRIPADGHSRTYDDAETQQYARAYGPGDQFLALVAWSEDHGQWRPRKVFVQPDELL